MQRNSNADLWRKLQLRCAGQISYFVFTIPFTIIRAGKPILYMLLGRGRVSANLRKIFRLSPKIDILKDLFHTSSDLFME